MRSISSYLTAMMVLATASVIAADLTPYLRDVPYLSQRDNSIEPSETCQNTTLAIVLRYYGAHDLTPDMITRRWGTVANWDLAFDTLAQERNIGWRSHWTSEGRLTEIQRHVTAGRPVTIHGMFTDSGHLVVVLGYDGDHYYVHDPWGDWTTHYSNRNGRYVRIEASRLQTLIGDRVRYHVPLPLEAPLFTVVDGTALPDSVVLGERRQETLFVQVEASAAQEMHLTVDLRAIGGPANQELVTTGDGLYHTTVDFVVSGANHGLSQITLRGESAGRSHQITRPVAVLPRHDVPLFDDGAQSGWQFGRIIGTNSDTVSTDQIYSGDSSLRIEARSFGVSMVADTPLQAHGFESLRFAFHPGDADAGSRGALSVYANGDTRTMVHLFDADAQPSQPSEQHGAPQVDMRLPQWQRVDVPLNAFTWLERPLESIHFQGTVHGSVYLDEISLIAARPNPVRGRWETAPVDSVVAGTTIDLEGTIQILDLATEGGLPRVTADLTSLDAGDRIPMAQLDDDRHELQTRVQIPNQNGIHTVDILITQDTPAGPEELRLQHRLLVLPRSDLTVFADQFEWEPTYVHSAELFQDDEGPVYDGRAALAVECNYFTIRLTAPTPITPAGYAALRFSFHPGTATNASPDMHVSVNDENRTAVQLVGESPLVDLQQPTWQVVEIPLSSFGAFDGEIESLRFLGNLKGRFYLDDIRLVPARTSSSPTAVADAEVSAWPTASRLLSGYPNPFNAQTLIRFDLTASGPVELVVYNIAGQRVRTLAQGDHRAGTHQTSWNGEDDMGRKVASGTYLLRLQAAHITQTRKLLLLQ